MAGGKVAFCREQGVSLDAIRNADGFARVGLLDDAVEALVASEETRRRYLDLANSVQRLYQAVLPDPAARAFAAEVTPVHVIAEKIRGVTPPADISRVMQQVEDLLDRSIATEGYVIQEPSVRYGDDHLFDLSSVDFEALAEKFKSGRKRTLNEKLKGAVAQTRLAQAPAGSRRGTGDQREGAGPGPAEGLHAGAVRGEDRGGVPAVYDAYYGAGRSVYAAA